MIGRRWLASLFCASMVWSGALGWGQPRLANEAAVERAVRHQSEEWARLAPHMPDPETGTAAALQTAGDVLRARRMPEDALDYYVYAVQRGGDQGILANRIGVTELELHRADLARGTFQKAIKINPKDSQAWNNLGAAEYVLGNFRAAIFDYQRAVKLNKKAAVYYSNLGTAYFEVQDYESGRRQLEKAVALDPKVFQKAGWAGIEAHVISSADRGRYCFEMARLAARQGDDENVMQWLAKASETGFATREEMDKCKEFDGYRKDPRVSLAIHNARAMRGVKVADATSVPALAAKTP
jgi:tetratricopeptide (TPR) repeat protein